MWVQQEHVQLEHASIARQAVMHIHLLVPQEQLRAQQVAQEEQREKLNRRKIFNLFLRQ